MSRYRSLRPLAVRAAQAAPLLLLCSLLPTRAARAQVDTALSVGYTERVSVSSTRLADQADEAREVPASTTVISREEIEASGAKTVQELLARIAGAIFFDQQGNALQTTFDLRGFTGGAITYLLDGARLNDPRNNSVPLETLLVGGIERIEITRGPAAATVGGGSAAGVVNIVTRAGSAAGGSSIEVGYGSFDTRRIAIDLAGGTGGGPAPASVATGGQGRSAATQQPGFDWYLGGARDTTDGFRQNSDGRLSRYAAQIGYNTSSGSRLSLSLHVADDAIGAPGALTLDEWRQDPEKAPFNRRDDSDVSDRQGVLNWRAPLSGTVSLAANLSWLDRRTQALTTGRAAPVFGGFELDQKARAFAGAAQATWRFKTGPLAHEVAFGGEGSNGRSDADSCFTEPASLQHCQSGAANNPENSTRRADEAFFAQDNVRMGAKFSILLGGRWDRSRFDYDEKAPDSSNDRTKTFSESSWKGGLTWNPAPALGLYGSYGESFAPPTVEDLFAFPGFGSNPDLDPTETRSYEAGLRGRIAAPAGASWGVVPFERFLEYGLSVFRADLTNEIVFDPTPVPGDPFGRNVNAGRSRHRGLEATVATRLFRWLDWSATYARTRATFENGPNEGETVPLVPSFRHTERLRLELPESLALSIDWTRVGEQVLDNDAANTQPRLDGYDVLDVRLVWRRRNENTAWARPVNAPAHAPVFEVFIEGRNILDETYATRGIYAFDFSTLANSIFVTPAPGRSYFGGISLTY